MKCFPILQSGLKFDGVCLVIRTYVVRSLYFWVISLRICKPKYFEAYIGLIERDSIKVLSKCKL